jgi:methanogenic corrinoid protein MtbC1
MIDENLYEQYLIALLRGDRQQCMNIVLSLQETNIKAEKLYTDLFQRSLYQVGDLWEQNRISVAVEHLATAITENLISLIYPEILNNRIPLKRKAVISCSINEYHQVGARMVADIMESYGWDCWFLGANTPIEDLLTLIQEKNPDLLGLSVSIYSNMLPLKNMIDQVRAHYPQLDIFVGGQAFRWGGVDFFNSIQKLAYIPSLEDLTQEIGQKIS